jgi:hypothetical protein
MGAGLDNGVDIWSDARAETIARTESMHSYNRATITGYGEFGVTTLLAYDGDQDAACAARDGQEFSIEEAALEDELEHPNGTLGWSPVVDKSWHEPQPVPVVVNVTQPSTPVTIHIERDENGKAIAFREVPT